MKKPWYIKYILQTGISSRRVEERLSSHEEMIQRYKTISAAGCGLVGFGRDGL